MEVPLEGTTSNYEALNENFMGDIRNAGYDERWMPNDCHGRPLEVNMDDFRRNMAAAENDDSGYGTYEQYVSNTGEPSGFGRSSSPIHGRSLKPDMDDFEPNMEEVENEGLGYGTYAQYMSNAGEPSDFEQPSSPTSWTSGGSHGQG